MRIPNKFWKLWPRGIEVAGLVEASDLKEPLGCNEKDTSDLCSQEVVAGTRISMALQSGQRSEEMSFIWKNADESFLSKALNKLGLPQTLTVTLRLMVREEFLYQLRLVVTSLSFYYS